MFDLRAYDEAASPSNPGTQKTAADLPDGNYDFEIKGAVLKTSKKQGTPILSMDVMVMSQGPHDGAVVERPSFITSQQSFDIVLSDFSRLGFDTTEWKVANNRPASEEIDKAVKLLPGLRFKGTKKTNGTFHNIYINERISTDGKPEKFGADELNAAPRDPF